MTEVGSRLGIAPTCAALGIPRATYYRRQRPQNAPPRYGPSPRALSDAGPTAVLAVLHEPRFVDFAPAEVYASLLDEGRYLCSERTMYRMLAERHEVRERRNQLRHPHYAAPELLARRPNELWSWDITKLLGPAKWTYFYLYVMLDVFSRYVVGWMVTHRESATLAEKFNPRDVRPPGHRSWAAHHPRRSRISDDLEASGALTRRPRRDQDPLPAARLQRQPVLGGAVQDAEVPPGLPGAVRSIQDVRAHCHGFFRWYNTEHHHAGLGLLTPFDVHHGLAEQRVAARAAVLATAYARHPERFPAGWPHPPACPVEVWINPPKARATEEARGLAATRGGVLDRARAGQLLSAHRSDLHWRGYLKAPA